MVVPSGKHLFSAFGDVQVQRWPWSLERTSNLHHPYVTAGNRVYSVATQHGEFSEIGWRQPSEMSGVWDHPIKLLDGFWLGISLGHPDLARPLDKPHWLTEADRWQLTPGKVEITYHLPGLEIRRCEYGVDDHEGMLVRLYIHNQSQQPLSLTLHFLARTDLRSAWLGEDRLIWRDGRDEAVYLNDLLCIAACNTANPAHVLFGAQHQPAAVTIGSELWATQQTKGQGISARLSYRLHLLAGATEEMLFCIAGSTRSSEAAVATYHHLQTHAADLCARQSQRYEHILASSALRCNDELIESAFGWAKTSMHMLERNVPDIGEGLAAGLPDYPWWFGNDTAYATLPLVASGQFELALRSLRNLVRYSESVNGDGAMVHEVLTQGRVHDNGLLVETPLFVRACYHAFRWTGDRAFLQEMYGFCKRGLLDVVLGKHDLEGDLCATGRGLVETRELQSGAGMKTLDIAAYTYEALHCLAELAEEAGDAAIIPILQEKAERLRAFVNAAWWIEEEGLYGDIYASAEALAASHQALRAEKLLWAPDIAELDRSDALLARFAEKEQARAEAMQQARPWLLKHMIAATPLETHLVPHARAEQMFRRLESDEFNGPWGIYLNPETQPSTMSLPNSVMAGAEAEYGRMDQALAYSHQIAATFFHRMPGAGSEFSPEGGCFIQAWSSCGILWPVVHYFLGFRPNVAKGSVRFMPHLPSTWHSVQLQDVRVSSACMQLAVHRTEKDFQLILETSDPSYEVTLGCAYPVDRKTCSATLNGTSVSLTPTGADGCVLEYQHSSSCMMQLPPMQGLHRYELFIVW